jgi:hypothetical protein
MEIFLLLLTSDLYIPDPTILYPPISCQFNSVCQYVNMSESSLRISDSIQSRVTPVWYPYRVQLITLTNCKLFPASIKRHYFLVSTTILIIITTTTTTMLIQVTVYSDLA